MSIFRSTFNHSTRIMSHILSHISFIFPKIKPRPTLIIIGLTNACNLKCSFCFQSQSGAHNLQERGERFMTRETFIKVLDDAKGLCNFIEFGLFGEPTMHPQLTEFIEIAKQKGFHLTIDSNGTLYNQKTVKQIVKNKVNSVVFSIDGVNSKQYENVRAGANFSDVKKSINLFKLEKENLNSSFPLLIARGLELESKTGPKHRSWMKNLGFEHILFSPLQNWSGLFSKKVSDKSSCTFPWLTLSVDCDGEVLPCCEDYNAKLSMGNVKNESLQSLWFNKKWTELRDFHRGSKKKTEQDFSSCIGCSYRTQKTLPPKVRYQLYLRAIKEYFLELKN